MPVEPTISTTASSGLIPAGLGLLDRLSIDVPSLQVDIRNPVDTPVWWGSPTDTYRSTWPAQVAGGRHETTMLVATGDHVPRVWPVGSTDLHGELLRAALRGEVIGLYGLSRRFNSFRAMDAEGVVPVETALLRAINGAGIPAFASADDDVSAWTADALMRNIQLGNPQFRQSPWTDDRQHELHEGCTMLAGLIRERFLAWLGAGSGVVVSTEPLAATARKVHPVVHVIPNGIDPTAYAHTERTHAGDVVHLGMTGYPMKFVEDLPAILPAMREAAHQPGVELHFFGGHPFGFIDPYMYHPLIPDTVAYQRAVGILDVAALPLDPDSAFNRARSGQKWMEFALHETACCVQRLEPYALVEDEVTGVKAGAVEEWRDNLLRLVRDSELRLRLGRAAKADVLAHHTMAQRQPLWNTLIAEAPTVADRELAT